MTALTLGRAARGMAQAARKASEMGSLLEVGKLLAEAQHAVVEQQRVELDDAKRELDSTLAHLRISEELAVARAREFGVAQTELADANRRVQELEAEVERLTKLGHNWGAL